MTKTTKKAAPKAATKKTVQKKAVKSTNGKTAAKKAVKNDTKASAKKTRVAKKPLKAMNQTEKREYWRTLKSLQAERAAK